MQITAGQRWLSDSEPEMGLGIILEVEDGIVDILFPAVEERRKYAAASAPIRRVIFSKGDIILTYDDRSLEVLGSREDDGVVTYLTNDGEIEEGQLNDSMALNQPQDRLLGGASDHDRLFRLRVESIYRNSAIKGSKIRGFVGARADLIPHQISIVTELAKRPQPRALLADEVGLGKTIEACMVMHRLHLTGRADRVLIVVPESLVHQWFVELLRRFNLLFSIFDEERCQSIENHQQANPFLDSQLVITSIGFLTDHPNRAEQAIATGWDMLVCDEAHHLEWSEAESSPAYRFVEQVAAATNSVLLLTATPQQLGPEGHFARLRLLDPERFSSLQDYLTASDRYEQTADLLVKISQGESLTQEETSDFGAGSPRVATGLKNLREGDASSREKLIEDLLDSFGPGRVMFRNTRDHLQGFPVRKPQLYPLGDTEDSKLQWLAQWVKEHDDEKALLITKSKAQALQLTELLQQLVNVKVASFHEELTLIQRDRNAAYFADPEGAQVLICSEIGSEGRNFQFASHLILFDLPEDPELLEQRIGRLDRIGQTGDIHIHVPYQQGTDGEILARWYHEGLNAFAKNLQGATEVYQNCSEMLELLKFGFSEAGLQDLIAFSQKQMGQVSQKLKGGQEKLLALNSFRGNAAAQTIQNIRALDADLGFEKFILRLFDHLGLGIDDLDERSYVLSVNNMKTDLGGDIPDEGLAITFDRELATSREDVQFMSIDHPLLRNALDVFLTSEAGNAGFGVWEGTGEKGIYLEAYYVAEVIAPAALGVDRFLTAKPIRVVCDHQLSDESENVGLRKARLREGNLRQLVANAAVKNQVLPKMLEACENLAKAKLQVTQSQSQEYMQGKLDEEIERLEELSQLNSMVGEQEIQALAEQKERLQEAIGQARLRLDSLRLIWKS